MRLAYHGAPKRYFESLSPSQPYVPEPFSRCGRGKGFSMLALLLYFWFGLRPAVSEIATEFVIGTAVLWGGGGGGRRLRRRLRLLVARLRRRPAFA